MVAILVSVFGTLLLPLLLSGKQWKAEQDKARARRLADARMNARLLRFSL